MRFSLAGKMRGGGARGGILVAVAIAVTACGDRPTQPELQSPQSNRSVAQQQLRTGMLPRFPEMVDLVPAVNLGPSARRTDPEPSDAELAAAIAEAGGKVMIGLKHPSAGRTRDTGISPGIDRPTALQGRQALTAMGVEITQTYRHFSSVAATLSNPGLAAEIRKLPFVDYVEPSFPLQLAGMVQDPLTTPQDTSWGVKKIFADIVWQGTFGVPTKGWGSSITILDSGIDEIHRFFRDGPGSMFLDCLWFQGDVLSTSCYDENVNSVSFGHGAWVASVANSRDDDHGFIGVAPQLSNFASIKVCPTSIGGAITECSIPFIIGSLDWAIEQALPRHIVNMSVGTCTDDSGLKSAVWRAANAGILLVASAGNTLNSGSGCESGSQVQFPARYTEVMAVSGTLEDDSFAMAPVFGCRDGAQGSRFGPEIEISAPFRWAVMAMNGGYRYASDPVCGTSFAAPTVAATAALVWSRNPTWTAAQVRSHLRATAKPLGSTNLFGSGRVNALKAVHGISAPPPPPPPPSVAINGPIEVRPFATCRWTAVPFGTEEPVTYEWDVGGTSVGDGSQILDYTNSGTAFTINVIARDTTGIDPDVQAISVQSSP